MKIQLLIFVSLLIFSSSYSQENTSSVLSGLKANTINDFQGEYNNEFASSYNSRFFGNGITQVPGFSKSFLNTPSSLTVLNASSGNIFGAAFASDGKLYAIEYTTFGAGNLKRIDTTNGSIINVGPLTGLNAGQVITGLAFDRTTSVMYLSSFDGTNGNLYTVNIANGNLGFIGNTTGSAYPIDIAINNSGQIFSCDISTDRLYRINKSTGAATQVGLLGIDINFAQGMAFDPVTDSLFLSAYTSFGALYRCNTTTGAASLIGSFQNGAQVDALVIPAKPFGELNAFNLQSPAADSRIITVPGSSTPVTISWDTSVTGASYNFIFGSPVVPPISITLSSNQNFISTTLGKLDSLLAAKGFTNNGSATDSAVGEWDVWAYKGPGAPGTDSLKATNGPRALTLKRQQASLNAFALSSPSDGMRIVTYPIDPSTFSFSWRKSGPGVKYNFLFKNSLTYSDPPSIKMQSNNSGFDTVVTFRNSQLDSLLANLGVAPGDSIVGVWRTRAYLNNDSLNSTAPDRKFTFRRYGLLPINESFSSTTFPPYGWSLDYTGTLYWSRESPGSYGTGPGSARFKFWSADVGVTQSLISNQSPPSLFGYVLRFNYSHRYYTDTKGVLAKDSLGIFTSTNNGANWVLLKTLITTDVPQVGFNSNTNLTTASGSGEYLTPANNEWASKIFSVPLGTNKVKFTAYSCYGNNLFIDDIYIMGGDGTQTQLNFIPERYSLEQNYPNPFNPVTKINFSIPKQSFVTLKIYDMLGREVAELVNKELIPNNYSIDFNASNLPSGVYFYKLETSEFTDVKRMMLIK